MQQEEIKLAETQILDQSNVVPYGRANGIGLGGHHNVAPDLNDHRQMVGEEKELQESVLAFDYGAARAEDHTQQIVNINQVPVMGGISNYSKLASVTITDFEWKYER